MRGLGVTPMSIKLVLHAPNHSLKPYARRPWPHWLPALGGELLLLVVFLSWFRGGDAWHGLAVVYAWSVYGLAAIGFLYAWSEPSERDVHHRC